MPSITTGCSAVAEVIIEVAPPALCAAGMYAVNPEMCRPWVWLTSNPAYKQMAKLAIEKGCDIAVEAGPDFYRIVLHDSKRSIRKTKRTYRALNKPAGMMRLMRYLTRH